MIHQMLFVGGAVVYALNKLWAIAACALSGNVSTDSQTAASPLSLTDEEPASGGVWNPAETNQLTAPETAWYLGWTRALWPGSGDINAERWTGLAATGIGNWWYDARAAMSGWKSLRRTAGGPLYLTAGSKVQCGLYHSINSVSQQVSSIDLLLAQIAPQDALGAMVRRNSGTQTVGTSTTTVTYIEELVDTGGFWPGSGGVLTVPVGGAGRYMIAGSHRTSWNSSDRRSTRIIRRRSAVNVTLAEVTANSGGNASEPSSASPALCVIAPLEAGDEVWMEVQNNGNASNDISFPVFGLVRIPDETATFCVSRTTQQNPDLVQNADTAVSFVDELEDSAGVWSAGTPTEIKVPAGKSGLWFFTGDAGFSAGVADRAVRLASNGQSLVSAITPSASPGSDPSLRVSYAKLLGEGDIVTLIANSALAGVDYINRATLSGMRVKSDQGSVRAWAYLRAAPSTLIPPSSWTRTTNFDRLRPAAPDSATPFQPPNYDRLIVPSAGWYLPYAKTFWNTAGSVGAERQTAITVNGSVIASDARGYGNGYDSRWRTPTIGWKLAANDYAQVYHWNGDTGNATPDWEEFGLLKFAPDDALGCSNYRNTSYTLDTNPKAISFTAEVVDQGGFYPGSGSTWTVPSGADGTYFVTCWVRSSWTSSSNVRRNLRIRRNRSGAEVFFAECTEYAGSSGSPQPRTLVTGVISLQASDTVLPDIITQSTSTQLLEAGFSMVKLPTGTAAFLVRRTSAQALGASTAFNTVTMDTEVVDDGGCYDPGSPTRFTVPAGKEGFWFLQASSRWTSSTTAQAVQIRFLKNGTTELAIEGQTSDSSNSTPWPQARWLGELAAGDYVEVQVLKNNSNTRSVDVVNFCGFHIPYPT